MSSVERVTVTLPNDLVRDIDRLENNRSAFVAEAVRREWIAVAVRSFAGRCEIRTPRASKFTEQGFEEWTSGLPEEDAAALVDGSAGKAVRWIPGEGWVEGGG